MDSEEVVFKVTEATPAIRSKLVFRINKLTQRIKRVALRRR